LIDLLEAIRNNGTYYVLWLMLGECMCADANLTPEQEEKNDTRLQDLLEALESFEVAPPTFIKCKEKIITYLAARESGEIGSHLHEE